jgi:hypothetical protein
MTIEMGKYRARVTDYGVTRSTGGQQHPTVFVTGKLTGRVGADGEVIPCPPETRTYTKAITPKTIDWLISDLKEIGYDRPGFKYLDPEVPGAVDLFDREITMVCDHESYEGSTRERWSIFREPARKKVARDELDRLDARFADELRKGFGPGKPAAEPESGPDSDEPGSEPDTDDVVF